MSQPQFSIIIPTFNARAKLEATLDSIRAQSFDDLEVLVMDGASNDGTREFLATQSDVSWHSEPDRGVYDAMNKGIARAKGRYLYFIGAGDTLLPGALKRTQLHLPSHDLGFVYGNVRFPDGQVFMGPTSPLRLRKINLCHQAIFYGREVFERVGLYDLRYPILSDYAFNLRCFGERAIAKIYSGVTVANYEGGGLSTRRDEAFVRDRLPLIYGLGQPAAALSSLEARIPPGLKAWRYQTWARLRARLKDSGKNTGA